MWPILVIHFPPIPFKVVAWLHRNVLYDLIPLIYYPNCKSRIFDKMGQTWTKIPLLGSMPPHNSTSREWAIQYSNINYFNKLKLPKTNFSFQSVWNNLHDCEYNVNVYPFLLTNTFRQNPFIDRTTTILPIAELQQAHDTWWR